jgi:hypothetical protein
LSILSILSASSCTVENSSNIRTILSLCLQKNFFCNWKHKKIFLKIPTGTCYVQNPSVADPGPHHFAGYGSAIKRQRQNPDPTQEAYYGHTLLKYKMVAKFVLK